MCGIAGWIGDLVVPRDTVDGILAALRHRGPNSNGVETFEDATLLHTRLKIIDLSPSASQPFPSPDRSVWTVFNGEIYNHHELRIDLERAGHRFHTRCDTEVIPALYLEYGADFIHRLQGMFAVAVFDSRRKQLLLGRDRFGIKPLYYGSAGRAIAFASELPALVLMNGLDLEPSPQAIHDYMALHYIPAPATIYRGVRAIEPGELIQVKLEKGRTVATSHRFHTWAIAPDPQLTLGDATERAGALLDRAVSSQLESDVPLGALLSGGIDSSLIAAAARTTQGDLHTFSVRFSDPYFDESPAASWVADFLDTKHRTLDFETRAPSWEHITGLLKAAGQPFADTSIFAVAELAKLVSQEVTVALSGDGGDEGFGGYSHYRFLPALAAVSRPPNLLRALGSGPVVSTAGLAARMNLLPPQVPGRLRDIGGNRRPQEIIADLLSWIRPRELEMAWLGPSVLPVVRLFEPRWNYHPPLRSSFAERLSALATEADTRLRLANDYLPKVDIATMRSTLEVRVPMLDEELFAFGLTLPHRLKADLRSPKRVLRSVAQRRVPGIATLPKHGFGVPVDTWMDAPLRAQIAAVVSNPSSPLHHFVAPAWLKSIAGAFEGGTVPRGLTRQGLFQRTVMLLSLHLALEPTAG